MGISGHMLGERKLRQLVAWSGIKFNRAYNRNGFGEGRVLIDGECRHYDIDYRTNRVMLIESARHWSSCPRGES